MVRYINTSGKDCFVYSARGIFGYFAVFEQRMNDAVSITYSK